MSNKLRELDILIAEKVFNEKVKFLNQKGGFSVDYMVENKDSDANKPIYAMDMVHDYKLKNFSKEKKYIFDLIKKINEIGLDVEMSQLDNGKKWAVSSWKNNYEQSSKYSHNNLPLVLSILCLDAYKYDISNLLIEHNVQKEK